MYFHLPVLANEVITLLQLQSNYNVLDCTLGDGGHAIELLKHTAPHGKVLGIDADAEAIERAASRIANYKLRDRVILVNDNFRNISEIVEKYDFLPVHGVVLDLGMSSHQLDESDRGFSFQRDSPLNMSFNKGGVPTHIGIKTAFTIVNEYSKQKLAEIFRMYGEVHSPGVIAQRIVRARNERSIKTTHELVSAIIGPATKRTRDQRGLPPKAIKLLSKVFQAIRIEVNDELSALSETLPRIARALAKGGRVAILSYHSLEDRIVKQYFKESARDCICPKGFPVCRCDHTPELAIITKRAITALEDEIARNPRARSAKLRVAERI